MYKKLWLLSLFHYNERNNGFRFYLVRLLDPIIGQLDNYEQLLFVFPFSFHNKCKEILWQKAANGELMTVGNYF